MMEGVVKVEAAAMEVPNVGVVADMMVMVVRVVTKSRLGYLNADIFLTLSFLFVITGY